MKIIKSVASHGYMNTSTRFNVQITEHTDTLIAVQIIKGFYNKSLDNRGYTVFLNFNKIKTNYYEHKS